MSKCALIDCMPQTLCYLVCYCSMFTVVAIVSCSVAVTRLRDVPYFGPALPEHAKFKKNQEFKELLLTKCKHYWKGYVCPGASVCTACLVGMNS